MDDQLNDLVSVLNKCKHGCPWLAEQTIESYFQELESELNEVREAISKKDLDNLKEELGDLLWDVLMMIKIAEGNRMFGTNEIISNVINKMKRRKPYIFDNRKVTKEEAHRIWVEAKEREKENKNG